MKSEILFLKGFSKQTLWAGARLQNYFQSSEPIGELWLISAQKNANSIVENIPLDEFFVKNKDFFNNYPLDIYPNLHKLIDASQNLSLQVHPDNEIAKKFASFGKDEAWFVLNKEEKNFLIGTKDKKIANKIKEINLENIPDLFQFHPLKSGDFAYISAGIAHFIPQGGFVYEIQQNSDLTFRIYDFERKDKFGNKRQLHLEEAKKALKPELKPKIIQENNLNSQILINNDLFFLKKIIVKGYFSFKPQKNVFWYEIIIISGFGKINGYNFKTFDAILVSGKINSKIEFISENATILLNFVKIK